MAIYAIGDIHGCYHEFKKLLKKIEFNPDKDKVFLVGDLINRGPKSLKVLDLIISNPSSIFPVLGNHDLAFLVFAKGLIKLKKKDTYDEITNHPECDKYINFLRSLPLMHYIPKIDTAICHAGIDPQWSISEALSLSQEVSSIFGNDIDYDKFIPTMFGNEPNKWDDSLNGNDRIRAIINSFTRMRFLLKDGCLDFDSKSTLVDASEELIPWFRFPQRNNENTRIIFGHWAALGLHEENNTICIDSGCVWGEKLTAIRLDCDIPEFTYKKA